MSVKQPSTLYHYTSQEGLVGIIQQKRIWGTEIRFLNDAQEFEYALGFTHNALKELRKKYRDEDRLYLEECRRQLDLVREELADTGDIPIFVCSFSSRGNLLSQWRGYCTSGSGYSLGFNFDQLNALATYYNLVLSQCLYHETDQLDKVKEVLAANCPTPDDPEDASPERAVAAGAAFVANFLRVAPTLKDPRFREENEWRLTSFDPSGSYVLHFRTGKSTLIPYVEFPLVDREGCFPLNKIYVGPTPLKQLAYHSVRHLLEANGIQGCAIQDSNIPYRSW